jgi:hypothetical protein
MLNEYLPNELLKEEFIKRDYLLTKIEKDNTWKGGNLVVPFKAAGASSVAFGSLTASDNVAEDKYVRGGVSTYKEIWGTMLFNQRDLYEHDMVSEQNFLKILPNTVEDFMDYMKNVVSINLMNGEWFAKLTAASSANDGLITVDRPDRFAIGQKVIVAAASDATGYVKEINMNTKVVKLVTTRGGSTVYDFSGNNAASGAKCYNDGAQTSGNAFASLRGSLLSAANGGDSSLYGVSKVLYPYLQAINVDGAGVTAVNIMEKIFDALTTIRQLGKGNPSDVVMSYKNFGSVLKVIEGSKGAFNVAPGSQTASQYGWTEIEVGSVTKGGLKIVAVQEADDDIIMFLDWRSMKFHSNGFFRKRVAPDGKEYFEIRNTTGYQYIIDVCLFGELVVIRPSYCGILYGISY